MVLLVQMPFVIHPLWCLLHDAYLSTSLRSPGECVSLSRRAAPHLGRLLLLLADPDVQDTVTRVLGDQAKAALEGVGLKVTNPRQCVFLVSTLNLNDAKKCK